MEQLADEELLLLSRMGIARAGKALFERYIRKAKPLTKISIPLLPRGMDEAAFLSSYLAVLSTVSRTYRFEGVRFETYFVNVLSHEMPKFLARESKQGAYTAISLSDPVGKDGSMILLGDVIPASGEDPRERSLEAEATDSFLGRYRNISENDRLLLHYRGLGYSYQKCADLLGLTVKKVRFRLKRVRDVLSGK